MEAHHEHRNSGETSFDGNLKAGGALLLASSVISLAVFGAGILGAIFLNRVLLIIVSGFSISVEPPHSGYV